MYQKIGPELVITDDRVCQNSQRPWGAMDADAKWHGLEKETRLNQVMIDLILRRVKFDSPCHRSQLMLTTLRDSLISFNWLVVCKTMQAFWPLNLELNCYAETLQFSKMLPNLPVWCPNITPKLQLHAGGFLPVGTSCWSVSLVSSQFSAPICSLVYFV